MEIEHRQINANGLNFHVALSGPEDGPPVVLLHGFPEYWGAWQEHIHLLSEAGFRVIAPDQRGYGRSDAPAQVKEYKLDHLVEDVLGIMDTLGHERAHIVGHDWGGAVAWQIGRHAPHRVDRLVVINCPPVDAMNTAGLRDPLQMFRSWYAVFFQLPWIPQLLLGLGSYLPLRLQMIWSARSGTFTHEALGGHQAEWARPGRMRGMINWYRAVLRYPPSQRGQVSCTALLLWGEKDWYLGTPLIRAVQRRCTDLTVVRYPANTHWLPHEAPAEVVKQMQAFFTGSTDPTSAMISPSPSPPE